jgi:hypothetical protein
MKPSRARWAAAAPDRLQPPRLNAQLQVMDCRPYRRLFNRHVARSSARRFQCRTRRLKNERTVNAQAMAGGVSQSLSIR